MWHKLKKDHKDESFSVEELEKLCSEQHARTKAYMLLAISNQKLFRDVMKNLQFTYQCNNNKYLETVTKARDSH